MVKPKVYVSRHLPDQARDELLQYCDAEIWDREFPPPYEVLKEGVRDKAGLLCLREPAEARSPWGQECRDGLPCRR